MAHETWCIKRNVFTATAEAPKKALEQMECLSSNHPVAQHVCMYAVVLLCVPWQHVESCQSRTDSESNAQAVCSCKACMHHDGSSVVNQLQKTAQNSSTLPPAMQGTMHLQVFDSQDKHHSCPAYIPKPLNNKKRTFKADNRWGHLQTCIAHSCHCTKLCRALCKNRPNHDMLQAKLLAESMAAKHVDIS
jgi:hypothetical protein